MATKKKKVKLPESPALPLEKTVTRGSHLTVTTYPDGRTELQWDWDALVRDVDLAIKSVDNAKTETKTTKKKSSKK